jgi:hypothetical protein
MGFSPARATEALNARANANVVIYFIAMYLLTQNPKGVFWRMSLDGGSVPVHSMLARETWDISRASTAGINGNFQHLFFFPSRLRLPTVCARL